MNWFEETALGDLDDGVIIEATCPRCLRVWLQSPVPLLIKVDHRDVIVMKWLGIWRVRDPVAAMLELG